MCVLYDPVLLMHQYSVQIGQHALSTPPPAAAAAAARAACAACAACTLTLVSGL